MEIVNITIENASLNTPKEDYLAFQEYWYNSFEFRIFWILRTFVTPVFIALGTIGNVTAFFILRQNCVKSKSMTFYLSVLVIVNTMVLFVGYGNEWVTYVSENTPLSNRSDWMCKLCQFIFNVIIYSSYWIVTLLLIDRTVAVWYPHYAPSVCTPFMAKLFTIFVYVGLVTVSIHAMWTYELGPNGCNIDPHQRDFHTIVWPWIAATFYSYLPIIIIVILLTSLLIGIFRKRSENREEARKNRVLAATITIGLVFVILTLPSIILNFMEYSQPAWSYKSLARTYTVSELFQKFGCLNHAVTHLIYFICITKFRASTIIMLKKLTAAKTAASPCHQDETAMVHSKGVITESPLPTPV